MARKLGETTLRVLAGLKQSSGFVSGELLSRDMGLSRMAVSKAVSSLRQQGYTIVSKPRSGYCLTAPTDLPLAVEVCPLLQGGDLGCAWVFEPSVDSTNRLAGQLAAAGAPHGLVVAADAQTGGRGRLQRTWHSPPGRNLYLSVVLRPSVAPARVPQVSLLAAHALREALSAACPGVGFAVKWPNDLWVDGRKLAGILCEMDAEMDRVRHVVVGVGINVNLAAADLPAELAATATSLLMATGRRHWRPGLAARFLSALAQAWETWLAAGDLTPFMAGFIAHGVLHGRRVGIASGSGVVEGVAVGIAADGRLLLRRDDGATLRLHSGDAHVLGLS